MHYLVSSTNKHVFWCPKGTKLQANPEPSKRDGWYFWDEAGQLGGGPYDSEVEADHHLMRYVEEVLGIGEAAQAKSLLNE